MLAKEMDPRVGSKKTIPEMPVISGIWGLEGQVSQSHVPENKSNSKHMRKRGREGCRFSPQLLI